MKLYFDRRDWWSGYYRGDNGYHYVCVLPTLVLRWGAGPAPVQEGDEVWVRARVYHASDQRAMIEVPILNTPPDNCFSAVVDLINVRKLTEQPRSQSA